MSIIAWSCFPWKYERELKAFCTSRNVDCVQARLTFSHLMSLMQPCIRSIIHMWYLVRCVVSESQVHAHWGTHGWSHCHVSLRMCCSYLWCRMSSPSANTRIHGRVICNNEKAFGVCIEMEWLWVTMTNSSNWCWQKQVSYERVVRYSSVHHQ